MFENLILNEKPIKVLSASGYDDGYYWELSRCSVGSLSLEQKKNGNLSTMTIVIPI